MPSPISPHSTRRRPSELTADWLEEAAVAIVMITGVILIATILGLMIVL